MKYSKRNILKHLLLAFALSSPLLGFTQSYPSKVIKFVVIQGAGSVTDGGARFFGDKIREQTGQTVVVENRPGADGNLAADMVARAAPDGYTVLISGNGTHAANVHLYKSLPFDPLKDFAPVTTFGRVPYILIANPERVKARNLKDFIAYAKANPGKLSYGSNAVAARVAVEQLKLLAGFEAVNIPYKTGSQAMTDLLGGQFDFYVADAATALVQIHAGRVVPLAVTMNQRIPTAPNIPTIAESGFPDYDFYSWVAVWVTKGSPPEATTMLSNLINKAMASDDGRNFLEKRGLLPYPGSPQMLDELQKRETERWGKVIKSAGMGYEL